LGLKAIDQFIVDLREKWKFPLNKKDVQDIVNAVKIQGYSPRKMKLRVMQKNGFYVFATGKNWANQLKVSKKVLNFFHARGQIESYSHKEDSKWYTFWDFNAHITITIHKGTKTISVSVP
jgi:hypothetical protein